MTFFPVAWLCRGLLERAEAELLDAATGSPEEQARAFEARERALEAHECMRYVLEMAAGSSDKIFSNASHPRDHDEHGVRADRLRDAASGEGMRLQDFVDTPAAQTAKLDLPHVAAIRIYTTAALQAWTENQPELCPKQPSVALVYIKGREAHSRGH